MDPITAAAAIGATSDTANNMFGMIGQQRREKRSVKNQEYLMGV